MTLPMPSVTTRGLGRGTHLYCPVLKPPWPASLHHLTIANHYLIPNRRQEVFVALDCCFSKLETTLELHGLPEVGVLELPGGLTKRLPHSVDGRSLMHRL